ncbi:poly(A) polymerase [Haematobacter missouriensis]|uniref:CCA tRNA nucleotidyltransferase n=1 Tax=Haematobacter missouriensis TaxID=366616 RepID=A0A212AU46_9RHOB|nr:CCA tRNA nucleotidyltransferase [Haematobacter missouriensis]KFI33316.1 poly(A) polymerase [Haematobacter missouriensis]OWJ79513.1 CCA tRNA nucleotidyltransferase [Haematobacter missouriensis]OWJ85007.1 CCA tRNA nucleotidyltransferase [Haematobacter missouriensis]
MTADRISGAWLARPETQAVFAALEDRGHRILAVGGCVRNALMGLPVTDVDMATDAAPEATSAAAEAAGLRAVPTGIDHGTITVVSGGIGHEVTTFRRDEETDGRHARVAFSTDLAEDAARRDFTMNALYATREGEVIDPLGGLPDLQAGRVRFVGDPEARIREDYLRILRFFRFFARYGADGPDPEGLAACAALAGGLSTLSRERVTMELRRLLAAPDPAPAVASMAAAGVLAQVLPGADPRALAPLVHLEGALPPDWLRRLAVLGGETEGLRLTREEARRLRLLREAEGLPGAIGYHHGAAAARDIGLVRSASVGTPLPEGWLEEAARGEVADFPVRAVDLAPLTGPALGQRLAELRDRWIASGFTLDRRDLLAD